MKHHRFVNDRLPSSRSGRNRQAQAHKHTRRRTIVKYSLNLLGTSRPLLWPPPYKVQDTRVRVYQDGTELYKYLASAEPRKGVENKLPFKLVFPLEKIWVSLVCTSTKPHAPRWYSTRTLIYPVPFSLVQPIQRFCRCIATSTTTFSDGLFMFRLFLSLFSEPSSLWLANVIPCCIASC